MKIIGIAGKSNSGKNTAAGLLAAVLMDLGWRVRMDGFGLYIREEARKLGWNGRKDEAGRAMLQQVGEDAARWCRSLRCMINLDHTRSHFLIIPDVRYDCQARLCRERGVLWFVVGRGGLDGEAGKHISEHAIGMRADGSDVLLPNEGSLEDLRDMVYGSVETELHLPRALRTVPEDFAARRFNHAD